MLQIIRALALYCIEKPKYADLTILETVLRKNVAYFVSKLLESTNLFAQNIKAQ